MISQGDGLRPFQKIAIEIRDSITTGRLRPGDQIPSLPDIRQRWGVALGTAQAAHDLLKGWGLVEARSKQGTYVLAQRPVVNLMTEMTMPGIDGKRRTWKQVAADYGVEGAQRVTDVGRAPIPPDVADAFGIEPDTALVHRVRLLVTDGRPAQIATSWYPDAAVDLVPALALPGRLPANSMQLLADAGYAITSGEDIGFARHATTAEAETLEIGPQEPVTEVLRVAKGADGSVVTVERMVSVSARLRQAWRF